MTLAGGHRIYRRQKTLELLSELDKYSGTDGYSLYLPPHRDPIEVEKSLQEIAVPVDSRPLLTEAIEKSPAGGAIFWSVDGKYLVLPPFPIAERSLVGGFSTDILRTLLEKDYIIGIVLVRLGAYAVGVSYGEILISSKVGTGNIHRRHKKGGSSAHRFERHRDKQIEYFFTRVCQHARDHLESYAKSLDYLVYGGARTTVLDLKKQCSFLGRLDTPTLPSLLDIPEPRQAVLAAALGRIWASTVYEWREAD